LREEGRRRGGKGLRRRRGDASRLRRDGLLARRRAGERGKGGRLAAGLREGTSHVPEVPRAGAATFQGGAPPGRSEGHRENRGGEVTLRAQRCHPEERSDEGSLSSGALLRLGDPSLRSG